MPKYKKKPKNQVIHKVVNKPPKNLQDVVLFISAGRADLKILVADEVKKYLVELPRSQVREFHQALLDEMLDYDIRIESDLREPRRDDAIRIKWESGSLLPEKNVVHDGKVVLVPAKLPKTIESLSRKEYKVRSVIIFNTHRGDSEKIKLALGRAWDEEPIALGAVLSRWLSKYFELDLGEYVGDIGLGKAGWVDILDADMMESGSGRDYPINREIVRKIDGIFQKVAAWDDGKLFACIATSGGMPKLKDIIKASANYRFGYERVSEWQEVKYRNHEWTDPNKVKTTHPAESLRARDHASRLIKKGDFAGAYAAVEHLVDDWDEQQGWIKRIRQVADYFAGEWPDNTRNLSPYLGKLIVAKQLRCLLVGFRVEAALSSGRIPEAVGLSSTFLEAAILDAIEQYQPIISLNEKNRVIVYKENAQVDARLTNSDCLQRSNANRYKYNAIGNCIKTWLQVLSLPALNTYNDKLSRKAQGTGLQPRNLRNINAHSLMVLDTRKKVEDTFIKQELWGQEVETAKSVEIGGYFLKQLVANNVFVALGMDNVVELYAELVTGLCGELADYDFS
jgi:hypothetical protein